jgi:hypothetical protein
MSVARLEHLPGFNIDRVAAAAGDDPDVLRIDNLDTDIPPSEGRPSKPTGASGTSFRWLISNITGSLL